MTFEQLLQFIAQQGFAIVVGGYLVYWITTRLNHELKTIENKLCEIGKILEEILDVLKKSE